jgi:hypothetical protein
MTVRIDTVPVVWRTTPYMLANNIFGTTSFKTKICPCCGQDKPLINYYVKENRQYIPEDALKISDFRTDCIICYDEKNINSKKGLGWKSNKEVQSSLEGNTIEQFLFEEVDKNA